VKEARHDGAEFGSGPVYAFRDASRSVDNASALSGRCFLVVTVALALVVLLPVVDLVALGFILAFLFYLLVVVVLAALLVVGARTLSRAAEELVAGLKGASAELENVEAGLSGMLGDGASEVSAWLVQPVRAVLGGAIQAIALLAAALFFSFLLLINTISYLGGVLTYTEQSDWEETGFLYLFVAPW
jgi:hypothetical protein